MAKAVLDPVGDRPVAKQRHDAAVIGLDHRIGPPNVQEALLLAGEARLGKVLRRRRRTHRDGHVALADPVTECFVGRSQLVGQSVAHPGRAECLANGGADGAQRVGVLLEPGTDGSDRRP